jgi:hypothetical protein
MNTNTENNKVVLVVNWSDIDVASLETQFESSPSLAEIMGEFDTCETLSDAEEAKTDRAYAKYLEAFDLDDESQHHVPYRQW